MLRNFRMEVRKFLIVIVNVKKRKALALLSLSGFLLLSLLYWFPGNQHRIPAPAPIPRNYRFPIIEIEVPNNTNYFSNFERYLSRGYLFESPTCSILNLDPFDPSVLPILEKESEGRVCWKGNQRQMAREWTYTDGSNIVFKFNTSALREDGFSFDYLDCCYIHFNRVQQSIEKYDWWADRTVKVSSTCTPIRKVVTQSQYSSIRVICRGKWPVEPDVLYRKFHALPLNSSIVIKRSNYWASLPKGHLKPPNIFLIGVDSTSRINFLRFMPKTKKVLMDLGFIEFLGYTKVGLNTFPNSAVLVSGYSLEDLVKICMFPSPSQTAQDNCPYIWKRFQNANYLTGLVEDWPDAATFNSIKVGFVHEPVDFVLRPLFHGVELNDPDKISRYCLEYIPSQELILKYVNDQKVLAAQNNVPLFVFSWLTALPHNYLKGSAKLDEGYAQFFKNFDYTNSIVIFLGDHGYGYGAICETFVGWYEEKLPLFWIYLPESLRSHHPNWIKNLKDNAKRLTSPFDFFRTMSHVLDEYTSTSQMPIGGSPIKIPRVYGESLFNPISINRTCDQAGIPSSYCACYIPKSVSVNHTDLKRAAQVAVQSINNMLTIECKNLTLVKVIAGAVLEQSSKTSGTYIVGFETEPGNFLFEAQVDYSKGTKQTQFKAQEHILRMNKISTDVSCVQTSELQRVCYCKFII